MLFFKIYAVTLCALLACTGTAALECYSCLNINDPSVCNITNTCNQDEACYQDSVQSGQTTIVSLGCINNQACGVSSGSGTLIGRGISKRQDNRCHECCATDRCNDILCQHRNPAACIDDETVDCPRMSSVFGICKDILHAKSLCPKFCKLCDVVDGVWSEWTSWSVCDVTCETGTQSRSRTCSNPAPAHGGLDCRGQSVETKQCQKQLCPVHGAWSGWTSWGTCSATCGVGIQRRQRSCTNPAPQRFGDHCFGLNLDDRICMPGPCTNGGWSTWDAWNSCSVSCGGGFHSRSRACVNPTPSPLGKNCVGDSLEVEACSKSVCKGSSVAFRSKDIVDLTASFNQTLVFKTVLLNEGNGYDRTAGIFTAPVPGTYSFHLQLCVNSAQNMYYAIVAGHKEIKRGWFTDRYWSKCYTTDAFAILSSNDTVYVRSLSTCSLVTDTYSWNIFSGVLVRT